VVATPAGGSRPGRPDPAGPGDALRIRRATRADWPALWPLWHAVVVAGETYPYDPDTGYAAAMELWLPAEPAETWLAETTEIMETTETTEIAPAGAKPASPAAARIVGTYLLRPNQPGLGDHVANAGFMVDASIRQRGVGRVLGRHCLARAAATGYRAMQFNAVVVSNTASLALWRSLGFLIVGTVPNAFRHRRLGDVDIHVMHRFLTDLPD
jgi:GNAT superfamily N-acetyltransferase